MSRLLADGHKSVTAFLALSLLTLACGEAQKPEAAVAAPSDPVVATATPLGSEPLPQLSFGGDAGDIERVVIVSIDTLRADRVGSYGAQDAHTRTMDRLAEKGVRFSTAISPAPITLPAHSTLLTGLDPPQHGVRHNGQFKLEAGIATLPELAKKAGFATSAFVSAYVLDRQFGLNRGFDHYDDFLGSNNNGHSGIAVPSRDADQTVDAAVEWLATAPERFLLFLHLYDPHADYEPPEPYQSQFGVNRRYEAEIAFADAEIGRLLGEIAKRWPGGTLVVLTSDHGESRGDHGEPTHSLTVYEATQHVPLIVAGPGVAQGQVVDDVVGLADVSPTVEDLMGLSRASTESLANGGRSLRPLWEGGENPARVAWVETLATQFDFGWSPLLGVRTNTHKYIRAPRPELYALTSDPAELENLAASEPELVRKLDALVSERATGKPIIPSTDLSADERAQLEALGYVTEGPTHFATELGVVGGDDPKDQMASLGAIFEGMNLLARRDFEGALGKFEGIGNRSFELSSLRGLAALGAHRLDIAQEAADETIRFAPHRGQSHVLLGQVAEVSGDREKAKAAYERGIEVEPSQGAGWVGLGRLAEAAGDREAAEKAYQLAMEARIYESEAAWRQAALAIENGQLDRARPLLASLPQAELRQPPAALRLAEAEQLAGKADLARIRVAGALRAYGEDVALLLMDASLKEIDGDHGGALAARRKALRIRPGSPPAILAVSRHLSERGQALDEARKLADSALAQFGRRPSTLLALAQAHLAERRADEALRLIDEALDLANPPSRPYVSLRRAEALSSLGRQDEAQTIMETLVSQSSGNPVMTSEITRTQARIKTALKREPESASP